MLSQVVVPVRFIGRRTPTEIAGILKHAKIAVVPSLWYETFGLVIVESILAGALPLVSRIGALKETIERFCGCSFAFEVDESKPYNERFLANVENLEIVLGSSLRSYEEIWQEFITKREEIVQNLSNPKYLRNLMKIYDLGGGGIILIDILLILAHLHARYPIVFLDSQPPAYLAYILRYAKLAVMPTKCYETFGLSIAESTLSGAIPLASGIGAYKDTVRQFCGFSFELCADNPTHLVAKMSEILGSYPQSWLEFESNRAVLVQDLSHQQYLGHLLSLYQK
ncbi:glycosyltransferase [uncultured Helicobacter sp.]|uniref:glycosyltransferase n=1 Tax=uncultured Helicobacter sp. TaxID=175537 RepID=UPI00374ED1C8